MQTVGNIFVKLVQLASAKYRYEIWLKREVKKWRELDDKLKLSHSNRRHIEERGKYCERTYRRRTDTIHFRHLGYFDAQNPRITSESPGYVIVRRRVYDT